MTAPGCGDTARSAAADADAARRGSGGGHRPPLVVVRADGHHHRRLAGARGRRPRSRRRAARQHRQPALVRPRRRHLRARHRARGRPRRARPPAARPPEPVRAATRPRHGRRVRTGAATRTAGRSIDEEISSALDAVRVLDQRLLDRSGEVVGEFVEHWRPAERDVVRRAPRRRGSDPRRVVRSGDRRRAGADAAQPDPPPRRRRPRRRPARVRLVGGRDGRHRADRGLPRRPAARTARTPGCSSVGSVGSPAWWRCPTPDAACTSTTRCRVSLLARRFAPAVCLGLDDGAYLLAADRATRRILVCCTLPPTAPSTSWRHE